MSAVDDGLAALTEWGTTWQKYEIQYKANAELATLRASLAAAQARVSELEAANAELKNVDIEISQCKNSFSELMNSHKELMASLTVTLTPRKCAPDCYRKGWAAAIEAAATLADELYADELSDAIRSMTPPADCGDCNPLAPDAITVSDFRRAVAHLVRYMPCDANDTNSTRLQLADAIESLTDNSVIDINSL